MPNIPRRKIYENMLEYEDSIIEIQILLLNNENFLKMKNKLPQIYENLEKAYLKIKALFIMFLKNEKFEKNEDFQKKLNKLISNKNKIDIEIFENKIFENDFKNTIKELNKIFENKKIINSIQELKIDYKNLDKFNHLIPEILTIRRDNI